MTRVGVTQRVSVVEEYEERRDCLDQAWTPLLESLGLTPVLLPNRIDDAASYLSELNINSLLLTSGNDLSRLEDPSEPAPERDRFETAALEYAIDAGVPVLGVCRGIEFLNIYFGGALTPVEDHVVRQHPVSFADVDGEIDLPDRTTVNSYHGYGIAIDDVADGFDAVGTAPDSTVECVVHRDHPIWGIMWHPERESPSAALDRQILTAVLGDDVR